MCVTRQYSLFLSSWHEPQPIQEKANRPASAKFCAARVRTNLAQLQQQYV